MEKLTMEFIKKTEIKNSYQKFADLEIWSSELYIVLVDNQNGEKYIYRSFKNKDK